MRDANSAAWAVMMLADGRFPAGGHAHSGGVERAVTDGRIHTIDDLTPFLRGRLQTTGLIEATFAAATLHRCPDPPLTELIDEHDARTLSPTQRATARALGRQLLDTARAVWVELPPTPTGIPVAMAWGLVGHVAGLDVDEVTHLVAYHCVSGPASAALRLLGLDPRAIQALLWHLGPEVDAVAHRAAVNVAIDRLPGRSSTLVELGAELHRYQEMRLFAS